MRFRIQRVLFHTRIIFRVYFYKIMFKYKWPIVIAVSIGLGILSVPTNNIDLFLAGFAIFFGFFIAYLQKRGKSKEERLQQSTSAINIVRYYIAPLLLIYIGYLLFNIYLNNNLIILYLLGIVCVTIGLNQIAFSIEQKLRSIESPTLPFSETLIYLVPAVAVLFQFYRTDLFLYKVLLGTLGLILIIISLVTFGSALNTALSGRKINFVIGTFILLVFSLLASYLTGYIDIVIIYWPFITIFTYAEYVRNDYLRIVLHESSNYLFYLMFGAMFIIVMVVLMLTKGIVTWPATLGNLYQISLASYLAILGLIVVIFSISVNNKQLLKPLIGLAQMCIVFTLLSIFGILIGLNESAIPTIAISSMSEIVGVYGLLQAVFFVAQIILLVIIACSFAPTLIYIYAMMKYLYSLD